MDSKITAKLPSIRCSFDKHWKFSRLDSQEFTDGTSTLSLAAKNNVRSGRAEFSVQASGDYPATLRR